MTVETKRISVETKADIDIVDITEQVSQVVNESEIKSGIVTVFASGSTASISTMEYEPNLKKDIEKMIERLVPSGMKYDHNKTWGDGNGKSHVRSTLMGPGITVPFEDKKILLGRWQHIVLLDFDVPARSRNIIVQIIGE